MYLNGEARDHVERTSLDQGTHGGRRVMGATPEQGGAGGWTRSSLRARSAASAVLRYLTDYLGGLDPGVVARVT